MVEPAPVVEELNPIELVKQKIEEAKLAKVKLPALYNLGLEQIVVFSVRIFFSDNY